MHKVDAPGATAQNEFQDGDPGQGVEGTFLQAKWHNTLQRELSNLVEGAGIALDDQDDTQVLQAMERLRGAPWNEVINGDFSVWERHGPSQVVSSGSGIGYVTDRWLGKSTPSSSTLNILPATSTDVELKGISHFARITQASGPGHTKLATCIEDLEHLANQRFTFAFLARCPTSSPIEIRVIQDFGSGGSAEVSVLQESGIATAPGWQLITRTIDIPSIDGKTLGDPTHLRIEVELVGSTGSPWTEFDLAGFRLVRGEFAGDFPVRPIALERALCRRYYQHSFDDHAASSDPTPWAGCVANDQGPDLLNLDRAIEPMMRPPIVGWYTPSGTGGAIEIDGVDEFVASEQPGRSRTGYPRLLSGATTGIVRVEANFVARADIGEFAGDITGTW